MNRPPMHINIVRGAGLRITLTEYNPLTTIAAAPAFIMVRGVTGHNQYHGIIPPQRRCGVPIAGVPKSFCLGRYF